MTNITEVVDDALLENLYCSICKNYLSVSPSFITFNNHSICGRCKIESNSLVKNEHHDVLAKQFNFPCQNASEGCEIVPNFIKVKEHEQRCPYKQMNCYNKDCMWSGIPVELIIHYRNLHPQLIFEEDSVRELKEDKLCYILVKNDFYFLLNYEFSDFQLTLGIDNLTYPGTGVIFICNLLTFHTHDVTENIPLSTDKKIVKKITKNSQLFVIEMQIPKHTDISVKCPQCQHLMTPPILRCPSGHITCADCFDTIYNYCVTCEKDDLIFKRDLKFESEAAFRIYNCRWTDCDLTFSIRHIKQHEHSCCKRLYKCLYFCPEDWQGFLNQLIEHHAACAKRYKGCPLETKTEISFLCKDIPESRELEYHLVAFRELFKLIIDFEIWGIRISIINYALPSLYGWYRYEVDLSHTLEPNSDANKTVQVNNRNCNMFFLDLTGDDILKFGGNDFLKVTVKIILLNEREQKINVDRIYQCYK